MCYILYRCYVLLFIYTKVFDDILLITYVNKYFRYQFEGFFLYLIFTD